MKTLHRGSILHTAVHLTRNRIVVPLAAAWLVALISPSGWSADAGREGFPAELRCTDELGQRFIDEGRYERAIREFTCVIERDPTGIEGYRGRIEAQLLLGRYAEALQDYARVTVRVLPVHPDAAETILDGYAARLAVSPGSIPALTGASFALWWLFDYTAAIHLLNDLLAIKPNDAYGTVFRGSSRLLQGVTRNFGVADLERALELSTESPDVHFIIADAYTYGLPDPERAFAEATLALDGGLDTPRIRAILGAAYLAFGDLVAAAIQIQIHIDMVTSELVATPPLVAGDSMTLDLVPGRTYEIPIPAIAGQPLSIATSSRDMWDTILVLLGPDGTPVLGSDDANAYLAAFDWVVETTGTYRMQVTSFESLSGGKLTVTRD